MNNKNLNDSQKKTYLNKKYCKGSNKVLSKFGWCEIRNVKNEELINTLNKVGTISNNKIEYNDLICNTCVSFANYRNEVNKPFRLENFDNDQIDEVPRNFFNGQRIEPDDIENNLNETSINQIDEFNSIEIPVLEKAANFERYSSFASKTSIDFSPENPNFNRRLVLNRNFYLEDLYYRMPSVFKPEFIWY